MTTNWLSICDNDSNISMTDDENTRPGMASISRSPFDAELDSSRCGVNLLIKKKMNILSEDSLSRKRSLNEMKSTDIDRFIAKMSKSPPKAKQKMNAQGGWAKTKTRQNKAANIGFGRFLNWADRGKSENGNRCVLGTTSIDSKRNILNNKKAVNMVTCTPPINHRRTQYRGRRTKKRTQSATNQCPAGKQAISTIEEHGDEDYDMMPQAEKQREEEGVQRKEDRKVVTTQRVEQEKRENGTPTLKEMEFEEQRHEDQQQDKPDDDGMKSSEMKESVRNEEGMDNGDDNGDGDGDGNGNGKESEGDEVASDAEEEDIDLVSSPSAKPTPGRRSGRSSARVTPKLERVVFSTDLLFSKVPILKKRDEAQITHPVTPGPVFLNADEFAERYPERAEQLMKRREGEQREDDDTDETTDCTKSDTTKSDSANSTSTIGSGGDKVPEQMWAGSTALRSPDRGESSTWASRLFASTKPKSPKGTTGSSTDEVEQSQSQRENKEERVHQMNIESVLPIEAHQCRMMLKRNLSSPSDMKWKPQRRGNSAKSSVSGGSPVSKRSSYSPSIASPKSCKSSTSSLRIVVPSEGATNWRLKQISYGKNTEGYKNFVKKFPNKDLRFRYMHDLVPTPDAKEKIGKKRWVGKYQKWRKFLHQFDNDGSDSGEDTPQ